MVFVLSNSKKIEKSSVERNVPEANYEIRTATELDIDRILELCHNSILLSCRGDYDIDQLNSWTYIGFTPDSLMRLMNDSKIFLMEDHSGIIGVASIVKEHHIHLLYIHHERQGCGYGKQLLSYMEFLIFCKGYKSISLRASITAKPFFLKSGYTIVREHQSLIGNQSLTSFEMKKMNDQENQEGKSKVSN